MAENINNNRSTGTVTWFSGWKGFGFIAPDEQDSEELFVHQTSINFEGYRTLHDGQRVEFDVEVGVDGRTRAINVDVLLRNNNNNNRRRNNNNNNIECYNCGGFGHLARDCYQGGGGGRGRGIQPLVDREGYGKGRGRGNQPLVDGEGYGRGRGRGGRGGLVIERGDGDDGERYGRGRGGGGRRGGGVHSYRGGRGGGRGRGCFNCGEEGHFARDCPNNNPQN